MTRKSNNFTYDTAQQMRGQAKSFKQLDKAEELRLGCLMVEAKAFLDHQELALSQSVKDAAVKQARVRHPEKLTDGELAQRVYEYARDMIVCANLSKAYRLALKKYKGLAPTDLLYEAAMMALSKAILGWNPNENCLLITYARKEIKGECLRAIGNHRLGTDSESANQNSLKVRDARSLLYQTLGREPSCAEMAEFTGLSMSVVNGVLRWESIAEAAPFSPMNSDEEEFSLCEKVADAASMDGYLQTEQRQLRQPLKELASSLDEDRDRVVDLLYFKGLTKEEVAKELDITPEKVSYLNRSALTFLSDPDRLERFGISKDLLC